jgi:hypothetical protein
MARSTGLILTSGAIVIGNEFVQKPGNWATLFRPAAATLGTALVFAGLEKLDEQAAVGLAAIVMITVLFAGINPAYKSPAAEVLSLLGKKGA